MNRRSGIIGVLLSALVLSACGGAEGNGGQTAGSAATEAVGGDGGSPVQGEDSGSDGAGQEQGADSGSDGAGQAQGADSGSDGAGQEQGADSGSDGAGQEQGADSAQAQGSEGEKRQQLEWTRDAVVYEVNVRQYTEEGTFAAFAEHLGELKEMGVDVLWFMPIHPISETKRSGTLGSYYSITDYRDTNPEFGSREDFKALVDQAHEMGFHVMMDWVANHTGWDCAWITEHPDWYTQENGQIISPKNMGWPDVADLNYDNNDLRTEMISCMRYWVEEFDVDGFRCDYAQGVPKEFWEEARRSLEELKPLYMLAEDDTMTNFLEYAFDFNYNLKLYETLFAVANDRKNASLISLYIPENLPEGAYTLNFIDNHDKNSYEHTVAEFGDAVCAMFSLIYTVPGVPLVYSGDEVGLDHAIEFMEKDAIDWESTGVSYRELLSRLAQIRSENPALYCGSSGGGIEYLDLNSKSVFGYQRTKDGNTVKCLMNLCGRELTVDLSGSFDGSEEVLLCGKGTEVSLDGSGAQQLSGEVTLAPWEFYITAVK